MHEFFDPVLVHEDPAADTIKEKRDRFIDSRRCELMELGESFEQATENAMNE